MLNRKDIDMMSPLIWAYMGDAVYEQFVRDYLINQGVLKNGAYHKKAIKYVSANAQVKIFSLYTNILLYKGKYLNDKKNGKGKEYDEDGQLIFSGEYLNGERKEGKESDTD